MTYRRNLAQFYFLLGTIVLFAATAHSEDRRSPNLARKLADIHTVVLLPPEIEVSQLDAGGVKEHMETWSESATENITRAIQHELGERSTRVVRQLPAGDISGAVKTNLDEIYALLDAINASILFHTYGPPQHRFEEKITNFDYSLGTETRDLYSGDGTALLIVQGEDHVWTGGRKALQALGIIVGLGAAVGTGIVAVPVMRGGTRIIATLVDPETGKLLWHNHTFQSAGHDLRHWESALDLTKEVLSPFPLLAPHEGEAQL